MVTMSLLSNLCTENPNGKEHEFEVDEGDPHFKVCQWCEQTRYRTDDELYEGKL